MDKNFVRKTIFIDQNNINKARKILNVKTEKDAVNRALEMVVEEEDIINAHKNIGGSADIESVYP